MQIFVGDSNFCEKVLRAVERKTSVVPTGEATHTRRQKRKKKPHLSRRSAAELLSQMRHWFVGEERVSSVNPIWKVGRSGLLLARRDMTREFSPSPLNAVDTDLSWCDGEVEAGFTNCGKSGASSHFVWGPSGSDTPQELLDCQRLLLPTQWVFHVSWLPPQTQTVWRE